MMGSINPQHPALLAAILVFAVCRADAAADENQDAVTTGGSTPATAKSANGEGQNAKKLALIRLLARAGKHEEAAAGMRALYPNGPPEGDPALEYYRIIGNTAKGWSEAKTGLEKLVKAKPNDTRYRLALASHLIVRPATRRAGIRTLAAMAKAKQPGVDKRQVLDAWQSALVALERSPGNIGLYREYLALDPGNAAVRNELAAVQRAEEERQPWLLRDKADEQLKEGHPEEAIATLKHALQLAPANPWVRFDLSRLYQKQGDKKQGRALMEEGMSVAPDDADMLHACALYLGLQDDADEALRLLDKIPAKERTPSIIRLKQKMAIQSQLQQAKALARDGRRNDAQAALERAGTAAGDDAELANDVANAWLDMGETSRGMSLLRRLLAQQSSPTVDLRLRYATLLNRTEHDDELAPLLDQLASDKKLSGTEKEDIRYLQSSLAARRADNLRHAGDYAGASAALAPALQLDPENTDLLMAQARVHAAAHQPEQARAIYQQILERTPGDIGARLALAKAMGEAGDKAAAQREMAAVLANTPAADLDGRMAIAGWYAGMDDLAAARTVVEQLKKISPDNPRVLVQAGRIAKAEGHYGEAMDDFKQANAADEIADLQRRRAGGYVTAGVDYLSKTDGASGISNLKVMEIPIEMRIPVGYGGGQAFVQVDPVSADAGTLQLTDLYNLRQYGKVLALAPSGVASAPAQTAHGTTLAAGYEGNGMRADIGTTPLGFPVSDVVGGIKWSDYTETTGFSFDLSRRPLTSSLLAYAGAHDPVSNEVWGGVRNTGISLHVSRDKGRLSGFADLGYYRLTGKNVLGNTESALRAGFDWSFIREEDMRLTAGLAFTGWHYRENLRYYTFGHGGYYSPQKYYSLAVPFRWTGRREHWSYLLQGSVSASASFEKDMPYYPISGALETLAGNPVFTGGKGHGTGWSLGGALERKFTPQLFGGVRLQIDRSDYYTPNFAILYLRFLFDAHTGTVPYPPEPVKAYSRF
jgi:tetratricopeptide (TPR) repeat protein